MIVGVSAYLTFYRSRKSTPVTVKDVKLERTANVDALRKLVGELQTMIYDTFQTKHDQKRAAMSKGKLPNFTEGDFVLAVHEEFHAGEKLCLRWRGPRRIIKTMKGCVYHVENLRKGD